jgi:uncharacterized membrane protein
MAATALIAVLWLAFAATHMVLSSLRLRPRLIAALGEPAFQGLYSVVALALFVPLVWVYAANKHAGPALWYLGDQTAIHWLGMLGMGAALVLVVGALLRPSPASLAQGRPEVAGVLRITRHPLFMGLGLFGLLHLGMARVHASDLVFFGGFALFAVIGCHHQDQRKRRGADEALRRFYAETPFFPFSRRGGLRGLAEMPLALAIGIALTAVLRYFHANLFG